VPAWAQLKTAICGTNSLKSGERISTLEMVSNAFRDLRGEIGVLDKSFRDSHFWDKISQRCDAKLQKDFLYLTSFLT
jgi:hypothetical protein